MFLCLCVEIFRKFHDAKLVTDTFIQCREHQANSVTAASVWKLLHYLYTHVNCLFWIKYIWQHKYTMFSKSIGDKSYFNDIFICGHNLWSQNIPFILIQLKHKIWRKSLNVTLTAWFRALSSTSYNSAKSRSSMTFLPRTNTNPC